jgi:integrase/recombinase XerD
VPYPKLGLSRKQLEAAAKRKKVWPFADPLNPRGMVVLMRAWLDHMRVRGQSERTVWAAEWSVSDFTVWCQEREILLAKDVTKPVIERYQKTLFYARKDDGSPLTLATQSTRLHFIKQFFKWLTRENHLLSNPASGIDLPKVEKRLPKHILTDAEAEAILVQPDVTTPLGIRDRALLETIYSTGIRRSELGRLRIQDFDLERGTLIVRQGKGRKDRLIPIGARALAWLDRYIREVRPHYVIEPDDGRLFLSHWGGPLSPANLSSLVSRHVHASGLTHVGGCHLFRHAMATLMLENGADIRFIQAMLGHVKLTTTEIYTHISIKKLKEIHDATHPSAKLEAPKRREDVESGEGS